MVLAFKKAFLCQRLVREGETERMQTLYYGKRLNAVFNCRAVSGRSQLELHIFVYIMLEYGNITT